MPKPVLQAMVLADHVYRDAESGKFLIIGTFGNLFVRAIQPPPPDAEGVPSDTEIQGQRRTMSASDVTQVGSPYLYLALTGLHGETTLKLKYVDLSDASVLFEGRVDVASVDPLALAEFSLPLPPLPRKIGDFVLDVLHDGEILGQWRVTVSVQTPPEEKEQDQ